MTHSFLEWLFLSITFVVSYLGFWIGWRKDYSVRTRLILGVLSLPTLVVFLQMFHRAYVEVGWLDMKNKKIEDGFYFSLIAITVASTFFIGAIIKKCRNPEQRVFSEISKRLVGTLFVIAITGICALLPLWLYLIARQGDAVIGMETLQSIGAVRPYIFWSFQIMLLLYWGLFVHRFCLPEFFTEVHQKPGDSALN